MTEKNNDPDISDTATPDIKTPQRRNISGLLIFVIFAIIIFGITYKPSVETIYCNTETLSAKPDVIMLGAIWCPYCYKARKYFVENKIRYCEYNIEDNGKGEQMYSQINNRVNSPGMQPLGIPILFIGDDLISGFDERNIQKLLAKDKPL